MDNQIEDIEMTVKDLTRSISYSTNAGQAHRYVTIKSLGNPLSDEKSLAILRGHYLWLAARDAERELHAIITHITIQ